MSGRDLQALVVGGGVGGLAAAAALRRAGADPFVVDGAERLDTPAAPVELWPATDELFDRLGVGETVRAASTPVDAWTLRRPDGAVDDRLETDDDRPAFRTVEYGRLRNRLRAALPARSVRTGTAVRGLEPGDDTVTVEFDNGVREPFDLVVGADGADSTVRNRLWGTDPAYCGTVSLAFPVDPTDGGATEVWDADGTVLRVLPGREGATAWLTAAADRPVGAVDGGVSRQVAAALEWSSAPPIDPGTEPTWAGGDFRVPTDCWARGRVALLGDAAHARHRLSGLGSSLAVEDAVTLASAVTDEDGPLAARLEAYAAGRRKRLRAVFGGTVRGPLSSVAAAREGRTDADGAGDWRRRALRARSGRLAAAFR